jgi:prevent-host-death family protein
MSANQRLSKVGVRELRQEASTILRRVKDGETIEITEHGKPIAQLSPVSQSSIENWVAQKLITPAKNPGTLASIKPVKSKTSVKEALDYVSADKI